MPVFKGQWAPKRTRPPALFQRQRHSGQRTAPGPRIKGPTNWRPLSQWGQGSWSDKGVGMAQEMSFLAAFITP